MSAYKQTKKSEYLSDIFATINIITLFKSLLLTLSSGVQMLETSQSGSHSKKSSLHLSFKYSWYLKNLFQMQNNVRETRRKHLFYMWLFNITNLLLTSAHTDHWGKGGGKFTFCKRMYLWSLLNLLERSVGSSPSFLWSRLLCHNNCWGWKCTPELCQKWLRRIELGQEIGEAIFSTH